MIVRGEEDKGVRIWSFGKTVYQSLLNIMLDEDYGDITDPIEGRDVKVICTKAPGRQWAMTEVRPRGKQSKLHENATSAKEWITSIPDIDEIYTCKTSDELEKIVNDWLNSDEESTGSSRGFSTPKPSSPSGDSTPASTTTNSAQYKSLDDAFADLEDL